MTIAIDDLRCLSVCHAASHVFAVHMAERLEVLLGAESVGNPRNIVLDRCPSFSMCSMRLSPNYFVRLSKRFLAGPPQYGGQL